MPSEIFAHEHQEICKIYKKVIVVLNIYIYKSSKTTTVWKQVFIGKKSRSVNHSEMTEWNINQ